MERVRERFPESGLAKVAEEILAVARETDERCRLIRRPNLPLRIGVVILIALGLALCGLVVRNVRVDEAVWDASNFIQASESLLGDVVFLGAAIAFLVTLETRIKRGRALSAINELRALAHIIDMHQLTKDPEMVLAQHAADRGLAGAQHDAVRAQPLPRLLQRDAGARLARSRRSTCRASRTRRRSAAVDEIESLTTGAFAEDLAEDHDPRPLFGGRAASDG